MRNSTANKSTRQANNMGRKRRYVDYKDDHEEVLAEKEPAYTVSQSAKRRRVDRNANLRNPSQSSQESRSLRADKNPAIQKNSTLLGDLFKDKLKQNQTAQKEPKENKYENQTSSSKKLRPVRNKMIVKNIKE